MSSNLPSLATPNRLRLTPLGRRLARLAASASLSILLAAGYSAFAGASAGVEASSAKSPYIKVTVKPGESLWSIAAAIDPSADRRDFVDELMRINRLDRPTLEAGDRIYIPTR